MLQNTKPFQLSISEINHLIDDCCNKLIGTKKYFFAHVFETPDVNMLKDTRKREDFIHITGVANETLCNIMDYVEKEFKSLGMQGSQNISYPLILKGVTYFNLDRKVLASKSYMEYLHPNVKYIIKHTLEGDIVTLDVYVQEVCNNLIVVDKDMHRIPRNAYFKVGSVKYDCSLKSEEVSAKSIPQLQLKRVTTTVYKEEPAALVYFGKKGNTCYKIDNSKSSKKLAEQNYKDVLSYCKEILKFALMTFGAYSCGLNDLKYIYTLKQTKIREELKNLQNSDNSEKKRRKPSRSKRPTERKENIITFGVEQIENLETLGKVFKDVDHQIRHSACYTVNSWQVSGYTKRLRNGKTQYFPPSIRYRRINHESKERGVKTYKVL